MAPIEYKHLTEEDRAHFLEHGWLRVPNSIDPKYLSWLDNMYTRLGYSPTDKSTWEEEYIKLPRHREVLASEFCPEAWAKMVELLGGDEYVDPVRERYFGDQFIVNFGSEERSKEFERGEYVKSGKEVQKGWHTDNDWYRHFLDSSGNALTIICCFTDIPEFGGGTVVCEDGIKGICEYLYAHPEGLDPPLDPMYAHVRSCDKYATIQAKAGDVFITHGLLPHSASPNYKHYARVITNPHVNSHVPWNLNREDGEYTMCERVVLRALGRDSIPEWKPTRERVVSYPRTAFFKRSRVAEELERMIAAAKAEGKGVEAVDSIYLQGEDAITLHEQRNGYDKKWGVNGVQRTPHDKGYVPETQKQEFDIPAPASVPVQAAPSIVA